LPPQRLIWSTHIGLPGMPLFLCGKTKLKKVFHFSSDLQRPTVKGAIDLYLSTCKSMYDEKN
ncbi:MAG: hypothetical protein AAFV25_27620, partial [Bacteroidota bacterium]